MAQQGSYQKARVNLISCMRLLQRGMKTKKNQQEYIQYALWGVVCLFVCLFVLFVFLRVLICRYIVQGEKLDGFMRHVQAQAALLDEGMFQDR
jgi:hypothetical protein